MTDDTFVYQRFQVHGLIVTQSAAFIPHYSEELADDLCAYFAVMPPVLKWRTEPQVEYQRDFETGTYHVRAYARGLFDYMVGPGGPHRFDVLRDE